MRPGDWGPDPESMTMEADRRAALGQDPARVGDKVSFYHDLRGPPIEGWVTEVAFGKGYTINAAKGVYSGIVFPFVLERKER